MVCTDPTVFYWNADIRLSVDYRIEDDGITPFDQIACRKALLDLRYEGPLTPPSERGTLLYPGPGGGMNWGSVAVDERRQLMVVNNMHLPFTVHMIPREQDPATNGEGPSRGYGIGGQQRGTPFSARVDMFSSPWVFRVFSRLSAKWRWLTSPPKRSFGGVLWVPLQSHCLGACRRAAGDGNTVFCGINCYRWRPDL